MNLCTVNGPSETKPNAENCKNCSSKCAYDCAQLQYTIQHKTVVIISTLTYLQTIIVAQMLSIGGQGGRFRHLTLKPKLRTVNLDLEKLETLLYRVL